MTGRVWVFGDSLNTDAMYPPDAMKLDVAAAAKMVFYQVRPGWTDEVQRGDIVVAGNNFGLGSSRPVAALFNELGSPRSWLRSSTRCSSATPSTRAFRP